MAVEAQTEVENEAYEEISIHEAQHPEPGQSSTQKLPSAQHQMDNLDDNSTVRQFRVSITKEINDGISPPTPCAKPRCRATGNSTTLRRSRWIAYAGGPSHSLHRAQTVLMKKLGLIAEEESLTEEARESYARLFEHPIPSSHVMALAALFGWTVPQDCNVGSAEPTAC